MAANEKLAPPALRDKYGAFGPVSAELVAKADAALTRISAFFGPWLAEEVRALTRVRDAIRDEGYGAETAQALNLRAHELKSLGATLGFPVITEIARSLCRLVEEPDVRMHAPGYLIDAHIDAIAAAARDDVRDTHHPVGRALVEALDQRVRAWLADVGAAPARR